MTIKQIPASMLISIKKEEYMNKIKRAFVLFFTKPAASEMEKIYKEWNNQRSTAFGPSDLAEIDAIFSRAINSK